MCVVLQGGWQQGNSHGPGSKYRFGHNDRGVDCMMLRVIYFAQSVTAEQGAFTVLPGEGLPPFFPSPAPTHGRLALQARTSRG